MAFGSIKGITIEFRGDTTQLDTALRKVTNEAKSTQNELRQIDRALKFNPKSVDMWKQKQTVLNQAIKDTKAKIDVMKTSLSEMEKQGLNEENSEEFRKLQREIDKAERELKEYEAQLRAIGNVNLQALGHQFQELGSKMTDVGKKMSTYVTGPLVGLGAAASKVGIEFDSEMSKVAAISGATGADFDALRNKAREMGRSTKFSATEAGQGFEYMAMAGWKTEDMLQGIEPILNLATAAGEDLGTTSDIVTDALTAFGLGAQDAGHFADILAAASSNANTNVTMLGESFKYAAPVAGALGFSAEDVSIALGLMANAGIKASSAGTALRTIFTNMSKPTDDMAKAMDELGISLDDGQGNMKSFKEIMDDLRAGFSEMKMDPEEAAAEMAKLDEALANGEITQKQYNAAIEDFMAKAYGAEGALKAEAAATLAGKTGMSGLLAIVNASDEDYQKLTDSIYDCEGATQKMADRMMDNAGGAIIEMKSALSDAAIAIADVLSPAIRKAADFINKLATKFASLSPSTQKIIVLIGMVVAAIGPLLVIIGTLMSSVGAILVNGGRIIGGLATIGKAIGTVFPIIMKLGSIIASINPWILLAVAAGVLLYKNWDLIKAKAQELWAKISETFTQIKEFLSGVWDGIKIKFMQVWAVIVLVVQQKIREIQTVIQTVFTAIKTFISVIWNAIKTVIQIAWQLITTVVRTQINIVKNVVTSVFNTVKTFVTNVWNGIKSAISTAIEAAKTKVQSVVNAIKSTVTSVFNGMKSTVKSSWNAIKESITDPLQKAKDKVSDILNKIKSFFPLKLGKILSFSLPKISVSSTTITVGDKEVKVPSFSISWEAHAAGGIFNKPTLLADAGGGAHLVGEAGAEAIIPLDRFWHTLETNNERTDALLMQQNRILIEMLTELQQEKAIRIDKRVAGRLVTDLVR